MDQDSRSDSSDTSSLHSVTASIAEALFRTQEGSSARYQTLCDSYIWPFDELTPHYERLSLEFKLIISGGYLPGGDDGEIAARLRAADRTGRVLDVGCGISGLWCSGMGGLFGAAEIIGLDLVPVTLDRTPPNVSFEIWDVAQGLPFRDNHFDVIRASSFAVFFPNYSFLLTEALRCLKPGGSLLLAEPDSRLHIGSHLVDWVSLQSTPPTSPHPSTEPHFFDNLTKTLQAARASTLGSSSSLPDRFIYIEEKLWLIPVGLNIDTLDFSRRVHRLSRLNTEILLLFFRQKLLDPDADATRCPTETNATFAWLERIMSGAEEVEGGEPILNPFKTVWARKVDVGEDGHDVQVKVEEEMVVRKLSRLGVASDADDEMSDF